MAERELFFRRWNREATRRYLHFSKGACHVARYTGRRKSMGLGYDAKLARAA